MWEALHPKRFQSAGFAVSAAAWLLGKLLLTTMNVHCAEFGTALQRRDRFARIEQAKFIERMLDGMKRIELRLAVLHTHLVDLFHSNTMLAGDGAADLYAQTRIKFKLKAN